MIPVLGLLMFGVRASEIRSYPLDDRSVYTIRLSKEEPTTCVFPTAIKAIVGANVSERSEDAPGILLSHEPGADYFSLRPTKNDVSGALNVLLRGKVYALALVTDKEPDRAVVFLEEAFSGERNFQALIAEAKELDRGAPTGGMSSRHERTEPGSITYYRTFETRVESIVRFEVEDALVFHITLRNTLDVPVPYHADGLAIRLGHEIFAASAVEASGAIPAKGISHAYLVVAGTPSLRRVNLSPALTYSVVVPHP